MSEVKLIKSHKIRPFDEIGMGDGCSLSGTASRAQQGLKEMGFRPRVDSPMTKGQDIPCTALNSAIERIRVCRIELSEVIEELVDALSPVSFPGASPAQEPLSVSTLNPDIDQHSIVVRALFSEANFYCDLMSRLKDLQSRLEV